MGWLLFGLSTAFLFWLIQEVSPKIRPIAKLLQTAIPVDLMQTQRESGGELQRILLVPDLRIVQKVVDDRYGEAEALVNGHSYRAVTGGRKSARIVPGDICRKLFVESDLAP